MNHNRLQMRLESSRAQKVALDIEREKVDVRNLRLLEVRPERLTPHLSGFRVQGAGFRVQGSGSRVQGSGSRVLSAECRVQG